MASSDLLVESEPVLKDWTMKRNCSVSPRQFVWFYVSLAVFSLLIAFMLDLIGAWLVLPFTGIELVAVGIAFAIYARHAVSEPAGNRAGKRGAGHAVRIQSTLGADRAGRNAA
jgi:uncharacterized membrane protein